MTPNLMVVPVLRQRTFSTADVTGVLDDLWQFGSSAAPGFKPAEGVVVFHHASRQVFKATIENDNSPKSMAA